ncbi:MAG: bacillithiol biosynthesis cysteine-adding enzyme BshC [Saprospiraceae bacterium]|nr:bacillithiol biosynthesis cysteine-adding enzyme BshC [Saprospiraceae bacterium]
MHISKVSFDKIQALSHKDVFYQQHYQVLKDFIAFEPTMEGLEQAIAARQKYPVDRTLLVNVLASHYENYKTSEKQYHNIYKLKEDNTYTIVTAHQPSLAGGPGYYFYKIFSTIHLAAKLSAKYPEYHFVPVFISGSEDHDFDEVKSLQLFGKTITWDTIQSGSVGRFNINGLDQVTNQIAEILGTGKKAQEISQIFTSALDNAQSYNDFVFLWLNDFFKDNGLIVLNMDDARLKKSFAPILHREITQKISENLVHQTQEQLSKFGFKPQAFARDINVFYIDGASRERLYFEDGLYKINNTNLSFDESQIVQILDQHPEKFSPNVVTRPLYEEWILPNLAYIGGGGELAYWLERKSQFEAFGIFFPVLIRRNSVMMIPKSVQKLMAKLQITEDDILLDEEKIITRYLERTSSENFHLDVENSKLTEIFHIIAEKAKHIDASLENFVIGEGHKVSKTLESIEGRLKRSLKQKEETNINQIRTLKGKLFPNHGLQERTDSYLQYLVSEDTDLTEALIQILDPLEKEFLFVYL